MMWQSLLVVARSIGENLQILRTPDDWQQAHFRRAISTAYYAMFHALLQNNADMLYGQETGQPKSPGWSRDLSSPHPHQNKVEIGPREHGEIP